MVALQYYTTWIFTFLVSGLINFHYVTGAVFYVSNGTSILKYNTLQTEILAVYSQRGSKIVGLAVDIRDNVLFWSDNSPDHKGIYTSDADGQNPRLLISDIVEVNGLSVDWISNHIYWTDAKKRTVEIANFDGTGGRVLLSLTSKEEPRGIVVDPVLGFMFWADQWDCKIERARLNGADRKVIVDREIYWPNQLTISRVFRKLYWVEASPTNGIMSCDIDGRNLKKERELSNITSGNPSFGLAVIGNKAIFSTWVTNAIYTTLVGTTVPIWNKEVANLGTGEMYSLISLDVSTQPAGNHPCGRPGKGGCSHLCLPSGWGMKYVCSCPSFKGLSLSSDKATCTETDEMVFYTFQDLGEVGFMNIESADSPQTNILGRSHSPSAVTYDPIEQMVYWSNRERPSTLYRSDLTGNQKEMFLDETDGLGFVDGLALDWVGRRLYFTNSGKSEPFLGGTTYPWQRVEMVNLDSMTFRTVVKNLAQPKRLAVDRTHGYLYIIDSGDKPGLLRTDIDGSRPQTLIDSKVLTNPLAISLFGDKVYIADGTAEEDSAAVIMYSGGTMTTLMKVNANILDIAATKTAVYVSTYSAEKGEGLIYKLELDGLKKHEIDLQGRIASGLYYSKRSDVAAPFEDTCEDAGCSHECIRVTAQTPPHRCICPEKSALMMTDDRVTCARPENFVLVADLNVIQMLSLDPDTDITPHTVHYGHAQSDIRTVRYDSSTDVIYWIDKSKIMMAPVNELSIPKILVDSGHFAVNDLGLDEEKQKLYWTEYDRSMHGRIMRIKLKHGARSTRTVISVDRASPVSILIHPLKKWMFWTQHTKRSQTSGESRFSGGSVHRAHSSGSHERPLLRKGLVWPTALSMYQEQLYVADAAGKIIVMELDGSHVQELHYLSHLADGIFDFKFVPNFMFYTNLKSKSVRMVDMETGYNVTIATNLSRPTSLSVFHPTNLKESDRCERNGHVCSHECVVVPRHFHCTCPVSYLLQADGIHCQKAELPWVETDSDNCRQTCSNNAICAQVIPRLQFQCICKEGYHGNGTLCEECPVNQYKTILGNNQCTRCPEGASTHGRMAAVSCSCRNGQAIPSIGSCSDLNFDITNPLKTLPLPRVTQPPKPTKLFKKDNSEEQMNNDWGGTDNHQHGLVSVERERIIGKPYFNNCPAGQTLTVYVPADRNTVTIPARWTAYDAFGTELNFSSNPQIRNREIELGWLANGEDGKQEIAMVAMDRFRQRATCRFHVLVEDLENPVFTYCPQDILVKTKKSKEKVNWMKPEASDNVRVRRIIGTIQSGSEFNLGITVVNFSAFDEAGNHGHCNFSVHVYQDAETCDFPIENGEFVCSRDGTVESCSIECDQNYTVNPLKMFSKKFSCDDQDILNKLQNNLRYQKACLEVQTATIVTQEFTVWFKGPCESDDPDLYNELSLSIVEYLKAQDICPSKKCRFSNISIECDYSNHHGNKDRRSYQESVLFLVKWNITMDNNIGFEDGMLTVILENIRLELKQLLSNLRLSLDSHIYTAVPNSVQTSELIWSCETGKIWNKKGCVSCPPGSMYRASPLECQICPSGTFQPYDKQDECFPCPDDKISEPGSASSSQCMDVSSLNDMSKFLIITACTFGFVFLVMAFIFYCQYKRQQRNKSGRHSAAGEGQKYITPNIYSAPPPLPRVSLDSATKTPPPKSRHKDGHLYSNHDYEDIGYNTGLSTHTDLSARTVYQNDFTNMSPPGTPRPLGSPVADRAIYNGDFRNFSPTPRTNSLRHQRRHNFHLYDE